MVAGEARLWLARVQYLGCVHHDFFRTLVYCVQNLYLLWLKHYSKLGYFTQA
jgi:hypothetical protein